MQLRYNKGCHPQITFTSDFHQLVQGDLDFGSGCVLRYDPLRLLEDKDTELGDQHVIAHVRFHPSGATWQGVLTVPAHAPLAELSDVAGQGYMLETIFDIPFGTEELEVWFSCTHPDGHTDWDSAFGKNYWLRFPLRDLEIRRAQIVSFHNGTAAQDSFHVEITASAAVDCVEIRWRATNMPGATRYISSLACVSESTAGRKVWSSPEGGFPVPRNPTIAFDIVYRIAGRIFTDDNEGQWYLADYFHDHLHGTDCSPSRHAEQCNSPSSLQSDRKKTR